MIKGSDTMVNLVMAWAEQFRADHWGVLVGVTGGGSGTGIAALINGSTDFAMCSREIKPKEVEMARARGVQPKEYLVALDGLAVVVHPDNPVDALTLEQLSAIFSGKIRNWKELGGREAEIVVLSREVNSGTHVYFKEAVLQMGRKDRHDEFGEEALLLPSSQAIADEVAGNPASIGYYGMGYISARQKVVRVAQDNRSGYFAPTAENVVSKKYPISRPLLFYTNGEPEKGSQAAEFLGFISSARGQAIVLKEDFVPARSPDDSAAEEKEP